MTCYKLSTVCVLIVSLILANTCSAAAQEKVKAAVPPTPAVEGRMSSGQTVYVPAYAHVYQGSRSKPFSLTCILSVRNTDLRRSITVTAVEYYDAEGRKAAPLLTAQRAVPPMGTLEVVVEEGDPVGDSGANFLVRWKAATPVNTPVVQAVMIGTRSGQGISFVCDGVEVIE